MVPEAAGSFWEVTNPHPFPATYFVSPARTKTPDASRMNSLRHTNGLRLLWSASLLTVSLAGFSFPWTSRFYLAPFGYSAFAPWLFIPLFLASFHVFAHCAAAELGWQIPQRWGKRVHPILLCLLVCLLLPAPPATKLGLGLAIAVTAACIMWAAYALRTERNSQVILPKKQTE